jgi:hypothetical protein
MKTRKTAKALKIVLRKKRRKRKMTTKQYYEQNTVFAHMCRLMLFCKCIINQRQCRTDVEESVGFFTRNGYVR